MSRKPSILRFGAAAFAAALLAACLGGTGTDTDNGVNDKDNTVLGDRNLSVTAHVVDGDGHPLEGVFLTLRDPFFRPDSGLPAATPLDSAREIRTDSAGDAHFAVKRPGKFVVEGRREGAVLFYDTLAVADSTGRTKFTFRSQAPRAFKGSIALASGFRIDSGVVFVRGTDRFVPLGPAGAYDLGTLPGEVAFMGVGLRYRASPVEFRTAEQRAGSSPETKSTFACQTSPRDSAEKVASYNQPAPMRGAPETVMVDSSRMRDAAESCDSLRAGTVVNVRVPSAVPAHGTADSATVSYVAVRSQTDALESGPVLVPIQGCMPAPGQESTTLSLQLQPTPTGTDVLVRDINASCLP